MPSRSKVEGWMSGHLRQAALGWRRQAGLIEQAFEEAQSAVGSAPWEGAASDRADAKLAENTAAVRGATAGLDDVSDAAFRGADAIDAAKDIAVNAISNAEMQLFTVGEDLSVTDRLGLFGGSFGAPFGLIRRLARANLESDIRAKALMLVQTDENVADALESAAESLRGFDLEGGKGGPGAGPGGEPRISEGPGPLVLSGTQGDLNATLPGTGIEISGDGRTHYPTLNGNPNPFEVPGGRPLPTGTIVGPDGKQYVLYSEVPYEIAPDVPNPEYATADTTVVDLADPSSPIGSLQGISQASGAYDPVTNRMVIVGNTGPHPGDRTRMLYTSDPIDPANPDGWMQTLKPMGEIQGLPGDRESQLVALKGGGFMVVGSDNFNPSVPGDQPVSAITAASPEGLLTAQAVPLFPPGSGWPGGAAPYGPTVVDTVYDPVTGKEAVQLRISTWETPPGWDGTGDRPYNPKTYDTQIAVQH